MSKKQPEYQMQCAFVKWITMQHKAVMVYSDTAAHTGKTVIQQARANKLQTPGTKWPDVFIAQPSGDYAGLFLEFKAKSPYKKDGITLLSNEHNEAQDKTMLDLIHRGYNCHFVWSLEMAIEIINKYLDL
jgi:hypothetical protein